MVSQMGGKPGEELLQPPAASTLASPCFYVSTQLSSTAWAHAGARTHYGPTRATALGLKGMNSFS